MTHINRLALVPMGAVLALAACNLTTTQQAQVAGAATTLAGVASATNTDVSTIVSKGALFCQVKIVSALPLVVALANLAGAPVAVTGMAADAVAAACALVNAVPVAPPANPAAAPVVAVATTLPPA